MAAPKRSPLDTSRRELSEESRRRVVRYRHLLGCVQLSIKRSFENRPRGVCDVVYTLVYVRTMKHAALQGTYYILRNTYLVLITASHTYIYEYTRAFCY